MEMINISCVVRWMQFVSRDTPSWCIILHKGTTCIYVLNICSPLSKTGMRGYYHIVIQCAGLNILHQVIVILIWIWYSFLFLTHANNDSNVYGKFRFFVIPFLAIISLTFVFYTSNLYWWGKGWPVDGLPFPDTGCPVPDVSIYYMSNINELPDGILFHWFCKCTPPWMFLPLDIPSEYRPEHVTFGLLCVIFKFPSRIFYRRVPGFATDCPCGVWCRGLTTCLLYVGPPLEF